MTSMLSGRVRRSKNNNIPCHSQKNRKVVSVGETANCGSGSVNDLSYFIGHHSDPEELDSE